MRYSEERKAQRWLHRLVILFILIQPLVDLDYLFYDYLNQFGLPRFATVVRFLILPALVIASFVLREKHKKGVFAFALVYGLAFLGYFALHTKLCMDLFPRLALTVNFRFNTWQELTYVLTLCLPYAMIYIFYNEKPDQNELKSIAQWMSGMISIPVVLGDLFVFGKSTYYGYTVANVFSWFNDIYETYHPRQLASKFFFNEGNTLGILLFMILPILYYFFMTSKEKKERRTIGILIFIQSLAMQMLATRVATYGCVVIPILVLVLYVLDYLIHRGEKIQKKNILFALAMSAVFGLMLNFTPAVENQKVDAVNDVALLHNKLAEGIEDELANAEDLVPGSEAYINFYVYMFESYGINGRYIQSVPSMYYTEYYSYQVDPKFWVDVMNMPVFDRVNGRQIETIFFNYKYSNLTSKEKLFGMGYSTMMNGSIVLEKDFKQQIYTLGYIGALLLVFPWIAIVLFGIVMVLRYFKKMFTFETLCYAVSLVAGLGAGWMSGHTIDQFLTTGFMALVSAVLLNKVKEARE